MQELGPQIAHVLEDAPRDFVNIVKLKSQNDPDVVPLRFLRFISDTFFANRALDDAWNCEQDRALAEAGEVLKCKRPDLFNFGTAGRPVSARLWTMPRQIFPEVSELPELMHRTADIGLALSGGGIRASCESFGVLQVLYHMGLLSKIRYISSNSGSSWLNAAFCYLPKDYELHRFFGGARLGPDACTLENLENLESGSFLKVSADAHPTLTEIEDLIKDDLHLYKRPTMWSYNEAVTCAYLNTFGLYSNSSVMSTPEGTRGHARAKEALSKDPGATVLPMRGDGPFPILNSSEMHVASDSGGNWYPLEFTPLYCGLAMKHDTENGTIGGGVVESYGYGSRGVSVPRGITSIDEDSDIHVQPVWWCPLSFAAGTSSGAPYVSIANPKKARLLGGEVIPTWSAADLSSPCNGYSLCADGGAVDNCAVLALVRRKVKTIISSLDIVGSPTDPEFVGEVWWPSLFGRATVGVVPSDPGVLNVRSKVFHESKWDELLASAKALISKGKPAVVEQDLEVLPNLRCGVEGGYTVKVVWVFNALTSSFKTKLPAETRQLLDNPASAVEDNQITSLPYVILKDLDIDNQFPFNTTFYGNYSRRLCKLHAELMAFNLVEGLGQKRLRMLCGESSRWFA
eukprot:CAMPEP_0194505744 /NCGR_PEP_ID=MMETSP0253-20130528/33000_1 /TAXON_ID=2966 /ORGANISM="Noctiluca scintillans" /LENGTH=628 /DNA_ID=CAMNT_0039348353 /DNA_START=30 /DNA_END=1916 /DNA_ORIENTATION=+